MQTTIVESSSDLNGLLDDVQQLMNRPAIRPTFLEVAGFPHYENVASNLLKFFLDPGECHGLGTVFLDALLTPLSLQADIPIQVQREELTFRGNRLDLIIDSQSHLIGIENKLFASVYNPLDDYLSHLRRLAEGREVALVLLCLRPPQPIPPGLSVITYQQLIERVRRSIGVHGFGAPVQYLAFALDFLKTMENLRSENKMDTAMHDLIVKREAEVTTLVTAADEFKKATRAQAHKVRGVLEEILPTYLPNKLSWRYWPPPGTLEGVLVHDVGFRSGAIVAIDAWLKPQCWEVTVWQRKVVEEKRWTLFFDRLPLVLKCYHEPKGTGSGFKPATGVVFSAAMSARAFS